MCVKSVSPSPSVSKGYHFEGKKCLFVTPNYSRRPQEITEPSIIRPINDTLIIFALGKLFQFASDLTKLGPLWKRGEGTEGGVISQGGQTSARTVSNTNEHARFPSVGKLQLARGNGMHGSCTRALRFNANYHYYPIYGTSKRRRPIIWINSVRR